jgi:DNA primase
MAAPWVSFDAVKAHVSIEDVLRRYGFLDSLQEKGAQLVGHCPFHSESKASFKVTPERNIWHCFGCDIGGDVIDLVRYFEGFTEGRRASDRRKAALLIAEWYGIESERPAPASGRKAKTSTETKEAAPQVEKETGREEEPEAAAACLRACLRATRKQATHRQANGSETPVNPPLTFELKNLDADHPYLRERGLTKETIQTFGLGYFGGKGTMQGRIVIPIHNEHGELVAYAGRWPGDPPEDEPKYKLPANFHKSLVLYNLHRAREYATEGLIVVEGFWSVFELTQRGRKNVIAVMGSSVSSEQEKLMVDTVGPRGRVLLAFDADDAGRKGMSDAAARLAHQVFVRTVELSL